jgi:ABC-type transport system substrate-binding protein
MIRLNKKSVFGFAVTVAAAAVLSMGCSLGAKGMTAAVSTLPDSLNPILEQNTMGLNVNELLFDGLTNNEVDLNSGSLYTDFALADEIVQDEATRKIYTVTLRDVLWHDGNPVTADDVVYSFQAYMLEENASPNREYLASYIEDVIAIDDKTVEIHFKDPIPEYNAYPVLTFKIIPSVYNGQKMNVNMRAGENERAFATNPVGTGPFKFSNWEIGKQIDFEQNKDYFKSVPKASTFTIKRTIDPVVRLNELRRGRINLILETNPMDRPTIEKMGDVDINSYMPYAYYEVAINNSTFSNPDARKAMAKALDKVNLIPEITDQDSGVIINYGPYPTDIFPVAVPEHYTELLPDLLPYDVEEAKALAASSGLDGQNIILIYPDSMGEFGKQLAEGVARQLSEIGLNVDARRTGDQVYERMVYKEKSFELAIIYRDGFDNMYSTMANLYGTNGVENVTGVSDAELDKLFAQAADSPKIEDWVPTILNIHAKMSDVCPSLFLFTLQKEVYSRGIGNVAMATDNPFLSAEDWVFQR